MGFILKRGIKPLAILLFLTIVLSFICDTLAVFFLLLTLFVGYLYRDTKRHIFENTQSVLSPVDGKIIAIDKVDEKLKIYCKVGLLDTHIVRTPISGEMKVKKYQKGLNLNPNTLKAKKLNEQISYKFISEDKATTLKLQLLSGFFNPSLEKIEKSEISQGKKIAFFMDGLAVISLKNEVDLMVNSGDNIVAGQTILYKIK